FDMANPCEQPSTIARATIDCITTGVGLPYLLLHLVLHKVVHGIFNLLFINANPTYLTYLEVAYWQLSFRKGEGGGVYVCVYICVYICVCICVYVYMCKCVCVNVYICVVC